MMTPTLNDTPIAAYQSLARELRCGLTKPGQKTLPSHYLYDELGSTLFEAITWLPEYGVTRAEERLLTHHAHEMVNCLRWPNLVAELGSGSGRKTKWLLNALSPQSVEYYPIDVSEQALTGCENALRDIQGLSVTALNMDYLEGLRAVDRYRRPRETLAVLFLGSTLGNFSPSEAAVFLGDVRKLLQPGDTFLLGTDLIKPVGQLLDAYCDPLGVTAAFNLNLLSRINREFDGGFDLASFEHVARFNRETQNVEMHIRALHPTEVRIKKLGISVSFQQGETIWTEASHKYTPAEAKHLGERAGFIFRRQWIDEAWPFAETLFEAL